MLGRRYFVGKFGKEDFELKLSEITKSFVLFELDSDGTTLHALFSNTDVEKGEKWSLQEDPKMPTIEFRAFSRKKKKSRAQSEEVSGQTHMFSDDELEKTLVTPNKKKR